MSERSTRVRSPGGLVGRDAELETLLSGVDSARRGQTTMVVVSGAAGVGKTALLDACARAADVTVLRGACSPAHGHTPFHVARTLLGVASGTDDVPVSQRLSTRVGELVGSGPAILALDDAQWCDEASFAWLNMLVRRDSGLPLLVLAARRRSAHRPPAEAAFGAAAARCRTVALGPLSEEDIGVLAGRAWGRRAQPAFVRACAAGSRGSPAFALRLFERLRAAGVSPVEESAAAAAEAALDLLADGVPAALDREPEYVRQVAQAVAVLEDTDPELVGMLSGVPERLVAVATGVLAGEGLLDAAHGAVLAGVGDLDRRRRLAARILNDAGRPPVEIGVQLAELTDLDEPWMRPMLRAAAAAAGDDGRPDAAVRFLRRLLAADPTDVAVLADFAGVAEERDPAAVHAALLDGLDRTDDPRDRARLGTRLGRVAVVLGRSPEVAGLIEAIAGGLDTATGADVVELRAGVEAALRMVGLGDRPVPNGPAPDRHTVHTVAQREVLALRSVTAALAGDPAAVALARRAVAGPPESGWAFAAAAYVLSLGGETEAALARLADADRAAPWSRGVALSLRALVREASGDLAAARSDATEALDSARRDGFAEIEATARTVLALVCCRRGAAAEAEGLLAGIAGHGSPLTRPHLRVARASLAELRGADEEAVATLAECATLPGAVFVPWWLDAARLLVRSDRRDAARELVATGEELAAAWDTRSARGLAALGRGMVEEDPDALAAAVELLAETPWYRATARILLGETLLRGADRTAARTQFREAVDLAARHGYRPLAERARAGLLAAGGRLYARTAGASGALTDGERRVAELAASGATNREIAEALLVALRTVEIHLTSAYRKLGVAGRTELAAVLTGRRPGLS